MFSTRALLAHRYYVPLGRVIATRDLGAASAEYPPLQVCVTISGCAADVGRSQQASEVGEVSKTVGAGDEHACVDGASDGRADVHGGEHRDVEHVADVASGERPVLLLDDDHAVVVPPVRQERGEREVAR